jgi:transcriptional regulator with XRE-family HTH domain
MCFYRRMVTETIERIRLVIRDKAITKSALAERAGLHPNTLQGVERDDWNPTASTLKAIEPHLPVAA